MRDVLLLLSGGVSSVVGIDGVVSTRSFDNSCVNGVVRRQNKQTVSDVMRPPLFILEHPVTGVLRGF